MPPPPKYLVGCYERLSREDGDKLESDSIINQHHFNEDFCAGQKELTIVKHYTDDGYTGTNFQRPGFRQLIADIEAGRINCVVVKDLSRFGRDYIDKFILVLNGSFWFFDKFVLVLNGLFWFFDKFVLVLNGLFWFFDKFILVLNGSFWFHCAPT